MARRRSSSPRDGDEAAATGPRRSAAPSAAPGGEHPPRPRIVRVGDAQPAEADGPARPLAREARQACDHGSRPRIRRRRGSAARIGPPAARGTIPQTRRGPTASDRCAQLSSAGVARCREPSRRRREAPDARTTPRREAPQPLRQPVLERAATAQRGDEDAGGDDAVAARRANAIQRLVGSRRRGRRGSRALPRADATCSLETGEKVDRCRDGAPRHVSPRPARIHLSPLRGRCRRRPQTGTRLRRSRHRAAPGTGRLPGSSRPVKSMTPARSMPIPMPRVRRHAHRARCAGRTDGDRPAPSTGRRRLSLRRTALGGSGLQLRAGSRLGAASERGPASPAASPTVDADADPARRRHAVLERAHVRLVVRHRLLVAGGRVGRWASKRARWSSGSLSSVKAFANSIPPAKASKRSTSPGSERCIFASGESSTG